MANNLLTPIVNNRTRSVNFFNGRLLTGEDLTAEQQANRVAHSLLGQAVGSGVAYGLEVSESATLSQVASPVLSITRGLAINSNGGTLLLDSDTDISLVRPASAASAGSSVFAECLPMQSGVYIAGAGVYLLTIGPASATQGLAEVSGVSTNAAPCNSKYKADGVQFRLIQLDLTQTELGDVNHLRNLVAYKCFGVADWAANVADPFGAAASTGHGLIDQLRAAKTITGCEVPLAVLYWTATDGVVFVDMWAVRRRLTKCNSNDEFSALLADQVQSMDQAMLLQFQDQLEGIRMQNPSPQTVQASDFFYFLPPLGFLPLAGSTAGPGFNYQSFFAHQTTHTPVFVADSRVQWMLNAFGGIQPIDLSSKELIWLYLVPTNSKNSNQTGMVLPYALFAAGNVPYQGDSRFNLSHWNFSNYSLTAGDLISL